MKDQKALYRKGMKVGSHYYPNELYRVFAKEWDLNGNVRYTIQSEDYSKMHCGVRQKDLFKA